MRIAHLISRYFPVMGGAQICVHNIAERHCRLGHEVTVIVPKESLGIKTGDYRKKGLQTGTKFLLQHCYPLGCRYLINQIKRWQAEYRFDLWQVTVGYPLGSAAIDFFISHKIPCVLRCTGEDIQTQADIHYGVRLDPQVDRRVIESYPRFNRMVAISQAMAEDYRKLGIPEDRIRVIPNGVDGARFRKPSQQSLSRGELGVPHGYKVLLTVGRNHPKKALPSIIPMAKALKARKIDFIWMVVGEGCQEIKELADQAGVGESILTRESIPSRPGDFHYPPDELIAIYQAADIFVFPTLIETFGIVVLEAMAAGLPVVTTNAPGVDELVEHGRTGLKSPVGDVDQMTENLVRLLEDAAFARTLGQQAQQVSQQFDWDSVAQRYLDLYLDLLR